MTSDLPTKRKNAITVTNISQEFLPTRWRQKSTGIDMEQNYVTVTLCIADCSQSTRCFKTAGPGAEIYSELRSASLEFFLGGAGA